MARSPKAFTLVGLIVSLTILAMCSVVAAFYYQTIIEEHQISATKVKLQEVRDAFLIWTSRNQGREPATIQELDALGRSDEATLDPWKNQIIIDYTSRLIISPGPDRTLGNNGTDASDDITEPLPPKVILTETHGGQTLKSEQKPIISKVYPTGAVSASSLEVGAEYTGISAAIDLSTVWFTIDGNNVASESDLYKNRISWAPKSGITSGAHEVLLKIQDTNGNFTARPWSFFVTPQP